MLHRVALSAAAQLSRVVGGLKCCPVNFLSSHQGDKKRIGHLRPSNSKQSVAKAPRKYSRKHARRNNACPAVLSILLQTGCANLFWGPLAQNFFRLNLAE
ncbi:hypothetical protein BJ956_002150 [Arthrobacter psychrochitiniphilus]|nr:hypothetical protein [Arthrobacter psychrochitiniphilus]